MRKLLLLLALASSSLYAQVTTSPSVTGVAAPQSAVAISGGTINGAVIGGTTPAAITGTTISATGAVTMPGLATSSAATTGTMCWTTGTGNVNVDTTVACLSSTIRVKQAVKPLETGLAAVMRMRPVSYDLKPQFNPEHLGRQVGLIAEEVGAIDPRLIALDDKGLPRGVRYMQLTAVLVRAIQQQQAQIKTLQDQIKHSKHFNHQPPRNTP